MRLVPVFVESNRFHPCHPTLADFMLQASLTSSYSISKFFEDHSFDIPKDRAEAHYINDISYRNNHYNKCRKLNKSQAMCSCRHFDDESHVNPSFFNSTLILHPM